MLGFVIKLYIIYKTGGLFLILSNLQNRTALLSGNNYYSVISSVLLINGTAFVEYYYLSTKSKNSLCIIIICIILCSFSLLIFGARKPLLMFCIKLTMIYHFVENKIKFNDFFKTKSVIICFLSIMFMVMVPMLRYKETSTLFLTPITWVKEGYKRADTIFHEFSYTRGDIFVFEYFNKKNYWYGKVYKNILVQWIPMKIYPNKPPMDDGVYLYNLMKGYEITPNTPFVDVKFKTSIPFTLSGSLYANFGLIGVIIGSFIVGCIYQFLYTFMKDCNYCIYSIIVYQIVLFEFIPSSLHTTSPIIGIIFISIFFKLLLKFKIRINNKKLQK